MEDVSQAISTAPAIHLAGALAILVGIISTVGIILLMAMFALFATPNKELGLKVGMLNDICVALQYLLTIPIALVLYQILRVYQPGLMRIATITGIASMLLVFGLQLMLVLKVIPFERQVVWVSIAMILGVGSWLVITGWVARSSGRMPRSVLISALAAPYLGYPVWAFWLGQILLAW